MRIVKVSKESLWSQPIPSVASTDTEAAVYSRTSEILRNVRERGDRALAEYSKQFDNYELTPETTRVSTGEIRDYAAKADSALVEILRKAIHNVREFHQAQAEESWEYYGGDGVRLGLRITPIER